MFFVAAAVAVISLSSCKKEYECLCSTAGNAPVVETHKGKDAADACSDATSVVQLKSCVPNE